MPSVAGWGPPLSDQDCKQVAPDRGKKLRVVCERRINFISAGTSNEPLEPREARRRQWKRPGRTKPKIDALIQVIGGSAKCGRWQSRKCERSATELGQGCGFPVPSQGACPFFPFHHGGRRAVSVNE